MSLDSSASDTSQPVELCLSGVETVALKTAAVDIEVQRAKAAPDTGIAWTKTRFRSNGPDTVEVVSNRPADFVFTQVPLGGSFAAELIIVRTHLSLILSSGYDFFLRLWSSFLAW